MISRFVVPKKSSLPRKVASQSIADKLPSQTTLQTGFGGFIMSDWHSIQYETQHRMATRTHDAALGHQGNGSFRLAVLPMWRGLIAGFAAVKARRRMDDRSTPGYEAHRA